MLIQACVQILVKGWVIGLNTRGHICRIINKKSCSINILRFKAHVNKELVVELIRVINGKVIFFSQVSDEIFEEQVVHLVIFPGPISALWVCQKRQVAVGNETAKNLIQGIHRLPCC